MIVIVYGLFVSLFLYFFVVQLYAIWPFTIDDMYITLRYAKHWATGAGIVWNVGELPVEGYSNFSFLVLARLAFFLKLNPVIFLKSTGVLGLLLTCVATYRLSRFWFSTSIALIPCWWLLVYKGQIIWAASGLETTMYEALVVFSVVFLFKGLGYQTNGFYRRYFVFAGMTLALASMTRPEAPALLVLFIGILYFVEKTSKYRKIVVFLSAFLVCFLPYFFWKVYFFGRLFPNPVYCKGLDGHMAFILDKHYLSFIWPFLLLSIPALYKGQDKRLYFLWLPSVLYLILLSNASDLVAFDNRLFLPAFVLLLPLSVQGMEHIQLFFYRKYGVFKSSWMLYCASVFIIALFIPTLTFERYQQFSQNPIAGEQLREKVLTWLNQHTHSNDTVVLADSGMIPYRSSLKYIDSYCLNNAWMTRTPRVDMYMDFCKHVLETRPKVIILTSLTKQGQVIYTPADACLIKVLHRSEDYSLQESLRIEDNQNMYRYDIYALRHL